MHRRSFALALLAVAPFAQRATVRACGDKFLVNARGMKVYRSAEGAGSARILIDARPSSAAATAVVNEDPRDVLRREGYDVESAATPDALARAVREEHWDLILVDAADAATIAAAAPDPLAGSLLPVLQKPTSAQLAAVRQQYTVALKGPLKTQAFIDAIGDALDRRFRQLERAARTRGGSAK